MSCTILEACTMHGCKRQQVKLKQGKLDCKQNNSTDTHQFVSLARMYPHRGLAVKTVIKLRFVQAERPQTRLHLRGFYPLVIFIAVYDFHVRFPTCEPDIRANSMKHARIDACTLIVYRVKRNKKYEISAASR